MQIKTASDFTGKVKFAIEAVTEVIPCSADDVSVTPELIPIQINIADGPLTVNFSIAFNKPDGEYFLHAKLLNEKDEAVFSGSYFFFGIFGSGRCPDFLSKTTEFPAEGKEFQPFSFFCGTEKLIKTAAEFFPHCLRNRSEL